MRIRDFEWDDGNELLLTLGHGIEPDEAEQVFAGTPLFRRTKRGHYAALGPASSGRLLVIVFELKGHAVARPITGWDMSTAERRYFQAHRGERR